MPAAFVKNGEIVLNVSTSATRRLTIDNQRRPLLRALLRHVAGSRRCRCRRSPASSPRRPGYGFAFTDRAGSRPRRSPTRHGAEPDTDDGALGGATCAGSQAPTKAPRQRRSRGRRTCRSSSSRGATGAARFVRALPSLRALSSACSAASRHASARVAATFAASCGDDLISRRSSFRRTPPSARSCSAALRASDTLWRHACGVRRAPSVFVASVQVGAG